MKPPRPLGSVRVLNVKGRFLKDAVVTVTNRAGRAILLRYEPNWGVFTNYELVPGGYTLRAESRRDGLEPQARDVDIAPEGTRETFVLGRRDQRYYYRGRVKVPFEHPNMYAVALMPQFVGERFVDLADRAATDLREYGIQEAEVGADLRKRGISLFNVAPGKGPAFERVARSVNGVRAAGSVVRRTARSLSFVVDEVMFQLRPGVSPPDADANQALRRMADIENGWILKASGDSSSLDVLDIANRLAQRDDVLWAEPNLFSAAVVHAV